MEIPDYIKRLKFYVKDLSLTADERDELIADLDSRNPVYQHLGFADVYGIQGQAVILKSRVVDRTRYEVSFACTSQRLFEEIVGDLEDMTEVFGESLFPKTELRKKFTSFLMW